MDALISAQAGTALLIQGSDLASIHADAPEQTIPRRAEEFHLLFGEALDLQVLQGVDREQVVQRLIREVHSAEALQLSLILLDPEMPGEIRNLASKELDDLLAKKEYRKELERVFYAQSLPVTADISGALAHAEHTPRARDLVRRLADLQPLIADVWRAWAGLPDTRFASLAERHRFQTTLVREGLFRDLVLVLNAGISVESFLEIALLHPILKKSHGYRGIISAWAEPFRDHCQDTEFQKQTVVVDEEPAVRYRGRDTEISRLFSAGSAGDPEMANRLPGDIIHSILPSPVKAGRSALASSLAVQPPEELFNSAAPKIKHILAMYRIPEQDAKEILQDLLVMSIWKADKIPVGREELWLLGNLKRLCLMYWRARRRRLYQAVDSAVLELLSERSRPSQEKSELLHTLDTLIERLPPRCSSLLKIRFCLGYEPAEAARRLGYHESSIRKITTRCLAALSQELLATGLMQTDKELQEILKGED